jgi:1-deoxy-D-xylulose-5-phosphate synthase
VTATVARLLSHLSCPADLRALPEQVLPELADEIRDELVRTVPRTGGHLGPNLGVVELTIALHRVFESPRDPIIFDTGHQSYVHKLLTGRAEEFHRLRQPGGLSGYPRRAESEHDMIENSHASTALCYADGLAKAFQLKGEHDRTVVAVVGDGALTGGMCWEALNNIGAAPGRPVLIVLNDNGRSYAPTVGALAGQLAGLRGGLADSQLFDQLGLRYLGPVDGHDLPALQAALHEARRLPGPTVLHCVTEKGRGYPAALADRRDRMHTVSAAAPAGTPRRQSWTEAFGAALVQLGRERRDIVAITAAMAEPTGLQPFAEEFADRCYDVGIAEQHAVASAAGLALGGLHPVVALYATFLNRAFDQILMDVALHRLPVTFVLDRAGITGPDGPSHHGMWDLGLLGLVPGLRLAAPRDAPSLVELLREAVCHDGPSALRFPKAAVGPQLPAVGRIGESDLLASRPGDDVLMVTVGPLGAAGVAAAGRLAADRVGMSVLDPRWLLPIDPDLVTAASKYRAVLTVEDGGSAGGFGDALCRELRAAGMTTPVRTCALPQRFLPHGERQQLLAEHGLDADSLAETVLAMLADLR